MPADVRVRLSAEGQAEVLLMFRRVQAEIERTAKASGVGFKSFGNALAGIRSVSNSLQGTIATLATVIGAQFLKSSADVADQLSRIQSVTDLTTTQLAGLRVEAVRDDVDLQTLQRTLVHFQQTTADLDDGASKGARGLRTLGISADQFRGQPLAQQLEIVSKAIVELPNRGKAAEAFVDIFGERAVALVPILRRLGEVGFAGLAREADRLGLLIDDDLLQGAGALGDEIDIVGTQFQGLATRFVGGVGPAMVAALQAIEDELGANAETWETWGFIIGKLLQVVLGVVTILLGSVAVLVRNTWDGVIAAGRAGIAALHGQFDEARDILNDNEAVRNARIQEFNTRTTQTVRRIFTNEPTKRRERPGDEDREAAAATTARIEAQRSAVQSELQLTQTRLKAEREANDRALDQSLVSLASYYAERRRLQQEGFAAEITALEKRRSVELQDPDSRKSAKAVSEIDAEISRKTVEHKAADVALTFEQLRAEERLKDDLLKFQTEIRRARGEEHTIRMAEIAEEDKTVRSKLLQEDSRTDRVAALRDAQSQSNTFRTTLEATENFAEANRVAVREMQSFDAERSQIERKVSAGLLSQVEGESRVLDLERERLVRLQEISTQLTATADQSGNPEAIQQARDFAASVDDVALAVARTESIGRRLNATFLDAGIGGVRSLFSELRHGTAESLTDFRQWAAGVLDSLAQVLEQMLAVQLVSTALGLGRGPLRGGAAGGGVNAGVGGLGDLLPGLRLASGGPVHGPGTGTSDSIVARLSHEEYVTRAARARRSDVRSVLDILNFGSEIQVRQLLADVHLGMQPFVLRPTHELIGFAAGGSVDAGVAGAALEHRDSFEGRLSIDLSPDLVPRYLKSRGGKKLIVDAVAERPRGVGRALGGR